MCGVLESTTTAAPLASRLLREDIMRKKITPQPSPTDSPMAHRPPAEARVALPGRLQSIKAIFRLLRLDSW
ncbi:hypothetical protein WR25_00852 [Diploscapter pachys]|uniref:Uncharacterized protein n=1 Tax=Diploscapter pachys TaxID=2018661 RepID=A0A2A2KJQ5_9BILA|nr:hypothetical protein WR25_00852 [Diploscapter pachys]